MRDVFGRPAGPAPDNPDVARAVALQLGVRPSPTVERCHGYANCCQCSNCVALEQKPDAPTRIRQPWEPLPLKAA